MLLQRHETKMLLLGAFGKYQERLGFKVYGFVIMDNHLHILIQIQGAKNLSVMMQKVLLSFGKMYRKDNAYVGYFWQGRFIAQSIISDKGMWEVINYVHNNPVKVNIVQAQHKYRYSSAYKYHGLINKEIEQLISVTKYGDTSVGNSELIKV